MKLVFVPAKEVKPENRVVLRMLQEEEARNEAALKLSRAKAEEAKAQVDMFVAEVLLEEMRKKRREVL
tara:strand:+ start:864 stop:1067 length:204 start_codon:yes stop_codon:yes gene_type:complete